MADQVRIVITATDKTDQGIKSVEGKIEALGSKARDSLQQIAAGAGVASAAIALMSNNALQAFGEMERNLKSLDAVERGFMGTTGTLTVKAKELQDQFFGLSATGGAIRNLISSGLGADEAAKLIDVFKERAILLGNAAVPLEQRLINLSQAFKTEQSELGDASGLTENFSQIVARGSEIVGKNAEEMSKAERAHAKYTAIVEMSLPFMGQSAEMAESLTGSQASLQQEMTRTSQAVGQALAPAYQSLLDLIKPLVQRTREYAEQQPNVVRDLTTMALGATAATTAVAGLGAAFLALQAATGGIGLIVAGIAAAVGALAGLALSTDAAMRKNRELRNETGDLMREYDALRKALDDASTSTEQKKLASERLKGVLSQLFEMQPQMRNWFDEEGKLLDGATERWNRYRDAVINARKVELTQAVAGAKKDLDQLGKDRNDALGDLQYGQQAFIDSVISQARLRGESEEQIQARIRELTGRADDQQALKAAGVDAKIAVLQAQMERDQALLDALNEPVSQESVLKPPPSNNNTTGGGGGKKADPYKDALRYMEFLKNTGRLTAQEEIAMLEEIQRVHARSADERMDIEERIYKTKEGLSKKEADDAEKARKAKLDAATKLLDHNLRMNQATTADEVQKLQEILATYELTEEEKMSLSERLAGAQKRFADEVAGKLVDQQKAELATAEARVRANLALLNHQERMGEVSKEQEIEALEAHLQTEATYYRDHADERWAIEERIYALKEDLRQADIQREKEAQKELADAVKTARQDTLKALADAEKDALKATKDRQDAAVKGMEREIGLAEERLRQFDKEIAKVDRLQKLQEAQQKVNELRQQQATGTGLGEMVFNAAGQQEWRVFGLLEAEKELEKQKTEVQRAEERERLQDQVANLRAQLTSLKEAHQQELEAHTVYWDTVKTVAENGFLLLEGAQAEGIGNLTTQLGTMLGGMLGQWTSYASDVKRILDSLPGTPATTRPPTGFDKANPKYAYATGVHLPGGSPRLAVVGEVPETILPHQYGPHLAGLILDNIMPALTMPTMPILAGGGGMNASIQVDVHIDGQTTQTPGAIGREVSWGVQDGLRAFRQGAAFGRAGG